MFLLVPGAGRGGAADARLISDFSAARTGETSGTSRPVPLLERPSQAHLISAPHLLRAQIGSEGRAAGVGRGGGGVRRRGYGAAGYKIQGRGLRQQDTNQHSDKTERCCKGILLGQQRGLCQLSAK